ncbi:SDR family oxidoreductase [Okibacterium endophyticum]
MTTHVITGAGSGIGSAVAHRLLDRGDAVVLIARDRNRAEELTAEFAGASVIVGDLARPERLADTIAEDDPRQVDTLLHIAGVVELGPVGELPLAAWTSQLTANLVSPAELTRLLLPRLRASRGHVLFVNSGAGLRANADWSAYAASKHGLKALADALRHEERDNGIRVTSVFPGRTATPMQEKVHRQEGRTYDPTRFIDPDSVATSILTAIDLPRDAEIVDLAVRPGPGDE